VGIKPIDKGYEIQQIINQEEVKMIGPLDLDGAGNIEFEQFLKIYDVALANAYYKFGKRKKELIAQRRKAVDNKDDKKYLEIHNQILSELTDAMHAKFDEILTKIKIDSVTFYQNLKDFKLDPAKRNQIREKEFELEEDHQEDLEERDRIKMTRDEILNYLKFQFEFQNEFIKNRSKDKKNLTA
jgi:hypothetical protein